MIRSASSPHQPHFFVRLAIIFAMLGGLIAPLARPTPAHAAAIAVGAGSYQTTLPAGAKVPSNQNGAPATPLKTANVTGPIPTNDWWSSLVWPYFGNQHSGNMHAHPLSYLAKNGGLGVGYPTNVQISQGTPSYIQEFHYHYAEDLLVGVAGLNSPDTKLDGYSDWAVTAFWSDGVRSLRGTFGRGLPFSYYTKSGGDAIIVFNGTPTIWDSSASNVRGVTINGHHYAIFAPTGASWSLSGTTLTSNLAGKDYFSIALLPAANSTVLSRYKTYAFSFVTNTRVSWSYDAATSKVNTTFNVTTTPKETGAPNGTIMALYRHQWANLVAGSTTLLPTSSYSYNSPRGQMQVAEGAAFRTSMTFTGVLPALPDKGSYDRTRLFNYVDQVYREPDHYQLPIPESTTGEVRYATDTYWVGKALGRMAQLVMIAEQVGHTAARDHFLSAIKSKLQDWLTAPDGANANLFYYNSTWGTLIGAPASFGADVEINDHHFHYGYFIHAAAIVALYDPAWASDAQWGGMLKLIAKDANNWDGAETRFPRLRNFDPYAGFNYASGHGAFGAGNNQESSSEGINYATGLILLGAATGDTAMRDFGIYLHTTESVAIDQYWMDVDNVNFPSTFSHNAIGIVWDSGGSYTTWFTDAPEKIHGINFLPVTGGSLHLGSHPTYIGQNYSRMQDNVAIQSGGSRTERYWQHVLWEFYALNDPSYAVGRFDANPNIIPEEGETRAHAYHWIHNLNALGRVDPTITANLPTYAVFNKNGTRTYVAYNPGGSAITATFSDGKTLSVPARSLVAGSGTTGPTQAPYGGTAAAIPGTIQAENFDTGGQNVAYFDADASNNGGQYRTGEAVDIEISSDTGAGHDVGWTSAGEWLEYTVNVASSGTYDLEVRVASNDTGGTFHVELNGVTKGGTLTVPNTNGWQSWTTLKVTGVSLSAGQQVLRLAFDSNGATGSVGNFNWVRLSSGTITQPKGNTVYVIDGAATGVSSSLAFAAGANAASDTVASAGGINRDGTPTNQLTYVVSGVSGTYDSTKATQFNLYVDAGANVGDGVQARISYDFTGDGTYDRIETYNYFPTNDVSGWELYNQGRGLRSATGGFSNLSNGRIRLEVWNAIGTHSTLLRTSATAAQGSQSTVTIPFTGVQ